MSTIIGMIGCDDPALARSMQEQLKISGYVCENRHVVGLSQLLDRALLEQPDVVMVVQPTSQAEELALLQELTLAVASHIVIIGVATDPRRILASMNAGAGEYIDIETWQTAIRESAVRFRLRTTNRADTVEFGQIIGIAAPGGGTGVSTVATNLAISLAKKVGSLMLMDLRLDAGDLAPLLNLDPQFSLADLCHHLGRLDDDLFSQILTPHPSGVQLLAAPYNFSEIEKITTKGLRRALAIGKRKFRYVLVDLGMAETPLHEEALSQCEKLLVVIRLDYPSIRNARSFIGRIESLGFDRSKIKLVVNRYGQRYQVKPDQAREALGLPIEALLPDDVSRVNYSTSIGSPVVVSKPWSKLARRLSGLANSLVTAPVTAKV
jgi:pilus assembly protein CpaE